MKDGSALLDLLKAPIAGITILLCLVAAKHLLGLQLDKLTKLGPEGVEFQQTEIPNAMADMQQKIGTLEAQVKELQGKNGPATVANEAVAASDATAEVPNSISKLYAAPPGGTSPVAGLEGYIWIGNYSGGWSPAKLSPAPPSPTAFAVGATYNVQGNMSLRAAMPPPTPDYYRGVALVGVVPAGTPVKLVELPQAVTRGQLVQYWAHIKVAQ